MHAAAAAAGPFAGRLGVSPARAPTGKSRAARRGRIGTPGAKTRGFCPACCGKRMAVTARKWVETVLPRVAVRQWVLTVPWQRRRLFARKPELMLGVFGVALRAIDRWYARKVGRLDGAGGSVAAIQRWGSALHLNVHGHALVPDGVWARDPKDRLVFRRARPSTRDVEGLVVTIARRAERWLTRQGFSAEEEGEEPDPEDGLALIQSASLGGVIAVGPRSGCLVAKRTQRIAGKERPLPARCASAGGYNLHAGVCVRAADREGLERLARYVLRGPLAKERIERRGEKVAIGLRREWSDGSTEILLSPTELCEKLAALVPRPRTNAVLYHGIFAANHRWRAEVVPEPPRERPGAAARRRARKLTRRPEAGGDGRASWAEMLRHSFGKDGWECPECRRPMRLRAVVVGAASVTIIRSLTRERDSP